LLVYGPPRRGVRGPKSAPVDGQHELFGFLTTEPNAVVAPIHPKAMPVILTTPAEVDLWLLADAPKALKLQRPLPDDALQIVSSGEKRMARPRPARLATIKNQCFRFDRGGICTHPDPASDGCSAQIAVIARQSANLSNRLRAVAVTQERSTALAPVRKGDDLSLRFLGRLAGLNSVRDRTETKLAIELLRAYVWVIIDREALCPQAWVAQRLGAPA
jgi:hypothetical protein